MEVRSNAILLSFTPLILKINHSCPTINVSFQKGQYHRAIHRDSEAVMTAVITLLQ
jgi:hypothetical protein